MALNKGETSITTIDSKYAPVGTIEGFLMAYSCKCRLDVTTAFSLINMSSSNISSTTIKGWLTYMLANPL